MVSRTDVAAFGIKLNEAVGEEGVGGEAVAKDKSVDEFAGVPSRWWSCFPCLHQNA